MLVVTDTVQNDTYIMMSCDDITQNKENNISENRPCFLNISLIFPLIFQTFCLGFPMFETNFLLFPQFLTTAHEQKHFKYLYGSALYY